MVPYNMFKNIYIIHKEVGRHLLNVTHLRFLEAFFPFKIWFLEYKSGTLNQRILVDIKESHISEI